MPVLPHLSLGGQVPLSPCLRTCWSHLSLRASSSCFLRTSASSIFLAAAFFLAFSSASRSSLACRAHPHVPVRAGLPTRPQSGPRSSATGTPRPCKPAKSTRLDRSPPGAHSSHLLGLLVQLSKLLLDLLLLLLLHLLHPLPGLQHLPEALLALPAGTGRSGGRPQRAGGPGGRGSRGPGATYSFTSSSRRRLSSSTFCRRSCSASSFRRRFSRRCRSFSWGTRRGEPGLPSAGLGLRLALDPAPPPPGQQPPARWAAAPDCF